MFTLLLGVLASILVVLHFLKQYKARKIPGPIGLPVFGSYLFLAKNPMLKLHELSKTYGNIFSIYIGSQYTVILDDWPAAKEILNKTEMLERNNNRFGRFPYRFGVSGTNGREWVEMRRVTSRAVKDVSLKKVGWDDILQEDTLDWVQHIKQEDGKPLDVTEFFAQRFISHMMMLFLKEQMHFEHPSMKDFSKAVTTIMDSMPVFGLTNLFPSMGKFLKLMDVQGAEVMTEPVKEFKNFVSDSIDSRIQDPVKSQEKDYFFGRFQEEIESPRKDVASFVTVDSLKGNAFAFVSASSETTRTSLIWTLIAMADHPDKQQKVHEELDAVIGKDGFLLWGEQAKVPYTYAAQLETLRWKTLIPFITRRSTEDLVIKGYHIPKKTTFIFNTWAMHNDSRFWRDPEQFIPERFLVENGQKVDSAPESYNPFSFGKRGCLGKQLALKAVFLIFTILMQKFKVVPKNGDKVEYDVKLGLTYQPRNVQLRFIPR